jgi:hypothetical protein
MTCINCNQEVTGSFCAACGQRAIVKRITFKEGWYDFWARIYGFDGMFPRTLRDLTIRPGVAARRFIDGNRVMYYGPVGYFFLMITVFLLLLSMMSMDFVEFMKGMQKMMPVKPQGTEMERLIQRFVADNLKLFAFIAIPLQAIASRYIFFRKSEFNFTEHLILPLFTMGHLYWLSMISAVYYKISGQLFNGWIQIAISVAYLAFAYTSFITYQPKWKSFLKGIGVYVVGQFFFFVLMTIVVVGIILFMAVVDPDSLQMFRPK